MSKRKLQEFFGQGFTVYVIEQHVKSLMKFASDGDFVNLKTEVVGKDTIYPNGAVLFNYKTSNGHGSLTLFGQDHKYNHKY